MIYCMSDIHGELDRFKAMLDLINFSSDDTLYIIGDVIDRHPGGVEILKIIKDTPNMFMLLSNRKTEHPLLFQCKDLVLRFIKRRNQLFRHAILSQVFCNLTKFFHGYLIFTR